MKRQKGFTLTELIVVIAIIGILAAVLIPAISGYIARAKKSAAISEATQLYHDAERQLLLYGLSGDDCNFYYQYSDEYAVEIDVSGSATLLDMTDVVYAAEEKITGEFNSFYEFVFTRAKAQNFTKIAVLQKQEEVEDILPMEFNATTETFVPMIKENVNTSFDSEDYIILSIEQPDFQVNYVANKGASTEFLSVEDCYYVGNANAFNYFPSILAMNEDTGKIGYLKKLVAGDATIVVETSATIDGTYTTFAAENYEFDDTTCGIKFDAGIADNYYRIVLSVRIGGSNKAITSMPFRVVQNAWNAYDAKDLSLINNAEGDSVYPYNRITNNYQTAWDTLRTSWQTQYGWASEVYFGNYANKGDKLHASDITGLIFHNDIELTQSDIIAEYFYTASELTAELSMYVGSLKDEGHSGLYYRNLATTTGNDFALIGNYFTFDASNFTLVEISSGATDPAAGKKLTETSGVESHSIVFSFLDWTGTGETLAYSNGTTTIKNIKTIGNTGKLADARYSGGLALYRAHYSNLDAVNVVASNFSVVHNDLYHISGMGDTDLMAFNKACEINIIKCKQYDNFNAYVYTAGGFDIKIIDSNFSAVGGPAIFASTWTARIGSLVTINTSIESKVLGQEGWFVNCGFGSGASFVPFATNFAMVPQIDASVPGTVYDEANKINLLFVLLKNGSATDYTSTFYLYMLESATTDYHAKSINECYDVVSNIATAMATPTSPTFTTDVDATLVKQNAYINQPYTNAGLPVLTPFALGIPQNTNGESEILAAALAGNETLSPALVSALSKTTATPGCLNTCITISGKQLAIVFGDYH